MLIRPVKNRPQEIKSSPLNFLILRITPLAQASVSESSASGAIVPKLVISAATRTTQKLRCAAQAEPELTNGTNNRTG